MKQFCLVRLAEFAKEKVQSYLVLSLSALAVEAGEICGM